MEGEDTVDAWLEGTEGEYWPLDINCPIGRSPSNSIVVADRKVSRRHAVVHRQDIHEYWLVDLGSANGSYVDGARVSLPSRLKDGNVIGIGDLNFTFRQRTDAEREADSKKHPSKTLIEVRTTKCWMLLGDIIGSTKLATQYPSAEWAKQVGSWAGDCRQIVELHGGGINKYLGDGFLAIWPARAQPIEHICGAAQSLQQLQSTSTLPFRLALHVGDVVLGGGRTLGEDSLSGVELVFLFRMEKLTSALGHNFLISATANECLAPHLQTSSVGKHSVEGFVDDEPREFFALGAAE